MKKIFYIILLTAITLSLSVSCTKLELKQKKETLPTGENMMYYFVDNRLVVPKNTYASIGGYIPATNFYYCDSLHESFVLWTLDLRFHFENGIQHISNITFNQGNFDIYQSNMCQIPGNHANIDKDNIFYSTHEDSGNINITYLSQDKKHFIGTFQMDVYSEDTTSVKHITRGHFNINLDKLNNQKL